MLVYYGEEGPAQPPIQWLPGVKQPGREADHSSPFVAEVKNACIYIYINPLLLHGMVLS